MLTFVLLYSIKVYRVSVTFKWKQEHLCVNCISHYRQQNIIATQLSNLISHLFHSPLNPCERQKHLLNQSFDLHRNTSIMKVALIIILYITVAYSCAITYWVKARYVGKTHLKYNISVAGFAFVPRFLDGDISHPWIRHTFSWRGSFGRTTHVFGFLICPLVSEL